MLDDALVSVPFLREGMQDLLDLLFPARLKGDVMEVRAFDADIHAGMLHGANLHALEEVFAAGREALAPAIDDLLEWADGVVLIKPASAEVMTKVRASGLPVVDVSRIAAPAAVPSVFHS